VKRREFIAGLGSAAAWLLVARAQTATDIGRAVRSYRPALPRAILTQHPAPPFSFRLSRTVRRCKGPRV